MPYLTAKRQSMANICWQVALVLLASTGSAAAQSCQAPPILSINSLVQIDTCQSSYSPSVLCNDLTPAGPSVVFSVYLAYPYGGYTLLVFPSGAFDPTLIVQTPQCGALGYCPYAIDNAGAGGSETFDLGSLDRGGQYYVLVTSTNPDATCGQAQVEIYVEAGGIEDGITRSGFEY